MAERVEKTDAEWRRELDPEVYRITREKGTERAFTGEYLDAKTPGTYRCACCGQSLFRSETKYESGTGWPSFCAAMEGADVGEIEDRTHGMVRTEVTCGRCDAHLGHVFPDGPPPTGRRYCLNSASLSLAEDATG
jgi:peptide-methionine (R)-S-oxide reductase